MNNYQLAQQQQLAREYYYRTNNKIAIKPEMQRCLWHCHSVTIFDSDSDNINDNHMAGYVSTESSIEMWWRPVCTSATQTK